MQHTILFSDTIWLKYAWTFAGCFLCHCSFTRFCSENSLDLRISVRLSKQLETERHQFESRSGSALLFCLVSERFDDIPTTVHVLLIIFSYHLIIFEGKELGIYHWNSSSSENGVALAFGQSWRERSTYQMPHNSISFLGAQKVISTVAHKGKTQLNIELDTQRFFVIQNNFTRCTTIFRDTKQFYSVHSNISWCKTIFHGAQQFFVIQNNSTRCTTIFLDARQFFTVHNNFSRFKTISRCTTSFRDTKQFFTVHNKLSRYKTNFHGAQQAFVMPWILT